MKKIFLVMLVGLITLAGCQKAEKSFTVLQWNIWHEGTKVPGGYEAIVNEIARLQPDFVTLSEVRNFNGVDFSNELLSSLKEKGLTYYSFPTRDTGLLSKCPIEHCDSVFPENGDHGSIYKLVSTVHGLKVAVYTAHLDWLNDAYYNVRGYDGSTWEEIPLPESVEEVLAINEASLRDDAIRCFIADARKESEAGALVILGGDFNEPSHLDWTEATKDLYCHNGLVIPWTVTTLLEQAGYVDVYRTMYPDVLKYPGFTFPADNPLVDVANLTWTPKADERERIDYVFYKETDKVRVKDALIFGPAGSIAYSERVPSKSEDIFLLPEGAWPTDHKGLLVTFVIK